MATATDWDALATTVFQPAQTEESDWDALAQNVFSPEAGPAPTLDPMRGFTPEQHATAASFADDVQGQGMNESESVFGQLGAGGETDASIGTARHVLNQGLRGVAEPVSSMATLAMDMPNRFPALTFLSPMTAVTAAIGRAIVGGDDEGVGDKVRRAVNTTLPVNPVKTQEKGVKGFAQNVLPQAAGTMATILIPGMAAGKVGTALKLSQRASTRLAQATAGAVGAGLGAAQGFDEAVAVDASGGKILASMGINAALGATEAVGAPRRFLAAIGGLKPKTRLLTEALYQGFEEATQEVVQQIGSNATARHLLDIERDLVEGVGEGGAAGSLLGFVMGMLGAKVRGLQRQATDDAKAEIVAATIEDQPVPESDLTIAEQIAEPESEPVTPQPEPESEAPTLSEVADLPPQEGEPITLQEGEEAVPEFTPEKIARQERFAAEQAAQEGPGTPEIVAQATQEPVESEIGTITPEEGPGAEIAPVEPVVRTAPVDRGRLREKMAEIEGREPLTAEFAFMQEMPNGPPFAQYHIRGEGKKQRTVAAGTLRKEGILVPPIPEAVLAQHPELQAKPLTPAEVAEAITPSERLVTIARTYKGEHFKSRFKMTDPELKTAIEFLEERTTLPYDLSSDQIRDQGVLDTLLEERDVRRPALRKKQQVAKAKTKSEGDEVLALLAEFKAAGGVVEKSGYLTFQGKDLGKFSNLQTDKSLLVVKKAVAATKPLTLAQRRKAKGVVEEDQTTFATPLKDRGQDFPQEVMEASRRLKATLRYKKLVKTVRGRFLQNETREDKIEMGDVANTQTGTHEIGHAIDHTMFTEQERKSLRGRAGGGKEMQLKKELAALSEIARGPVPDNATENHRKYRAKGKERFSDFISVYTHDPAKAREVAPEFTRLFEDRLTQFPDVQNVLTGLHEGDVEPGIPTRRGETETPVETPGKQPEFAPPAQIHSDPAARAAAEDLVRTVTRKQRAEIGAAAQRATNMQEAHTETELEEIGAATEGIGLLQKKGDTGEAVAKRLTPKQKKTLKQYRFQQEHARQEVNKYLEGYGDTEYLSFLDDYLAHFYVKQSKKKMMETKARLLRDSPNAKQRKLPTLKEAVGAGMIPITQNVATLYKTWTELNWRVATNRAFVHELKNVVTEDGGPVILPKGDAPQGWVEIDHPAIQKVYAHKTDEALHLWRGGAAVHPDIAPAVKMMLESPLSNKWIHGVEVFNAYRKRAMLSLSLFHHIALTESAQAVLARGRNPIRGLVLFGENGRLIERPHKAGIRLMKNEEFLRDYLMSGATASHTSDTGIGITSKGFRSWEAKTRGVPVFGKIARRHRQFQEGWDRALWDRYHTGLKVYSYHSLTKEWLSDHPDATPQQIKSMKELVGSFVNDAFGGQEWQNKFWANPKTKQMLHALLLAPDWTLSNINIAVKTATEFKNPFRRKLQMRYWRNMIPTLYAASAALQATIYAAFGDEDEGDQPWTWKNERKYGLPRVISPLMFDVTPLTRKLPWRNKENAKQRVYAHFGKQALENLSWAQRPDKTLFGKSSPIAHTIVEQFIGISSPGFDMPWVREDVGFWEGALNPKYRLKALAQEWVPFSMSDTNFAFAAPMSKGMTKWKARKYLTRTLDAYANPGVIEGLKGVPNYTDKLDSLVGDILDAAEKNGIDGKEALLQARRTVRGNYYRDFFEALEDNNEGKMKKIAEAMQRLGVSWDGITASAERRGIILTQEDITTAANVFDTARTGIVPPTRSVAPKPLTLAQRKAARRGER